MGLPQDWAKANELLLNAGELGCVEAYYNLGNNYHYGRGIEVDKKKAKHHWEFAAMNGYVYARYNLGVIERKAGNTNRAMRHYILAAKAGHEGSLNDVKKGFMAGYVTKDDYANTLRAYQTSVDEMKSGARDKAEDIMT